MQELTIYAPYVGVASLVIAFLIFLYVKKQPSGNDVMKDLEEAIHDGAMAFLKREYSILLIFIAVVFTIAIAPTAVALYNQLVLDHPLGDEPQSNIALMVLLVLLVIMLIGTFILFKKMKLVVEIRSDGLYYRYPPFIPKFRSFPKQEIKVGTFTSFS